MGCVSYENYEMRANGTLNIMWPTLTSLVKIHSPDPKNFGTALMVVVFFIFIIVSFPLLQFLSKSNLNDLEQKF